MTLPSFLTAVPLRNASLSWTELRFYLFVAAFTAGNLLVPFAIHTIPNAGAMFLPLFFFTLIAAWQFGFGAGLLVAVLSPLLNTAVMGMPTVAMLPVVVTKSVALALAASVLAGATKTINLPGLLAAVAVLEGAGFLAERIAGLPLARSLELLTLALPGMVILLVGGYFVLRLTNRLVNAKDRS